MQAMEGASTPSSTRKSLFFSICVPLTVFPCLTLTMMLPRLPAESPAVGPAWGLASNAFDRGCFLTEAVSSWRCDADNHSFVGCGCGCGLCCDALLRMRSRYLASRVDGGHESIIATTISVCHFICLSQLLQVHVHSHHPCFCWPPESASSPSIRTQNWAWRPSKTRHCTCTRQQKART